MLGPQGTFQRDGNALYFNDGGGYTTVYICHNSSPYRSKKGTGPIVLGI